MVNSPSSTATADRRERQRGSETNAVAFGSPKLNPFGDLHTVQHLSARLARALRGVFEPVLRRELRTWAEPLVVQRFADYRAERPEGLTAWMPLTVAPSPAASPGKALVVFDGRFVLEMLDLFFGGNGDTPKALPSEFSPAAEAMVARIAGM
jgi:flagellar motor switch protein FliM